MNARLSYRKAAVPGASPVRLVILLYEQAVEDLRRALAAHGRGDIEARTREINHAILVIAHLQSSLDKDQGGMVAINLERFYNQVRASLVDAQCRQSAAELERQISFLMQVHQAWCEVERAQPAGTATGAGRSETHQSELGQTEPDQMKPGQTKLGETKLDQTRPGHAQPGQLQPEPDSHLSTEWNA
ncbi:MAG TPA: flagellar export chaperone FliS [Candidatus Sulfotelmatobacter sp.]|jgi:flagellar protein FliS